MTTRATLRDAWAVYRVDWLHPSNGRNPFYIGACPINSIGKLPDAARNSEFAKHVAKGDPINVMIIAVTDEATAQAIQTACVGMDRPHCNIVGIQSPLTDAATTRIECVQSGDIYASVKEAAKVYGVTETAIYRHLKGDLATIAGQTLRRL